MTEKPEFNDGWGPALKGEEWEAYKKKQREHIAYHQDFIRIYSSLCESKLSSEVNSLINAAFGTINTAQELLSHMSFVRAQREKPRKDGSESTRQNKLKWEDFIYGLVKEYVENNNRIVDTELEHYVVGQLMEAERKGQIKNKKGQAISAPIKSVKPKIKLAFQRLGLDHPYPTRKKIKK